MHEEVQSLRNDFPVLCDLIPSQEAKSHKLGKTVLRHSHTAVLGNRATPGLRVTSFSPHFPALRNLNISTPKFKNLEKF